jgi:hypothetical protein
MRQRELGDSDFEYIVECLLPEWRARFAEKNVDYGDDANRLGTKGAFVDIYRKVGKLKRAIWDDQELRGEQPREILLDLVGHCFLTIASMDRVLGVSDDTENS